MGAFQRNRGCVPTLARIMLTPCHRNSLPPQPAAPQIATNWHAWHRSSKRYAVQCRPCRPPKLTIAQLPATSDQRGAMPGSAPACQVSRLSIQLAIHLQKGRYPVSRLLGWICQRPLLISTFNGARASSRPVDQLRNAIIHPVVSKWRRNQQLRSGAWAHGLAVRRRRPDRITSAPCARKHCQAPSADYLRTRRVIQTTLDANSITKKISSGLARRLFAAKPLENSPY